MRSLPDLALNMALILPTIGRLAARSSEKLPREITPSSLSPTASYSAFSEKPASCATIGVRLVAEFGHGLHQQDAVGGVARRHQHVGVGRLELLHLGRQRRRVGAVFDVGQHLVAALARELELGVAGIGAEDGVLVEQRQRLDLGALLLHGVEEVEHRGREHLVVRRGAEIEFQAAAMQARRGVVGRDERDLIALADLADGDGDRALIGADDGADLFLRDQALGLGAALLRIGLVVGEHQL